VTLVLDGAAHEWDANVLVINWLASGREIVKKCFRIFGDGLNILEILEVSLVESPTCDSRLVLN
jgi:hypothetical protein